jgi:hypothetical protein
MYSKFFVHGKYGICLVVIHYKEANISIEQHEGEISGAIIVDNTGGLVGKQAKAEYVGN